MNQKELSEVPEYARDPAYWSRHGVGYRPGPAFEEKSICPDTEPRPRQELVLWKGVINGVYMEREYWVDVPVDEEERAVRLAQTEEYRRIVDEIPPSSEPRTVRVYDEVLERLVDKKLDEVLAWYGATFVENKK